MVEAGVMCPAPTMNASDMLPFVVDSRFIPSGYEGDFLYIKNVGDKTGAACGSRATTTALGSCYAATYTPPLIGSAGFAAVVWQYPTNNFGMSPGYLIPPGATKVVFYAKGKNGGEVVSFAVGQDAPSVTTPCPDSVIVAAVPQTLTTTWTQYTIPLNSQTYAAGENSGFIWVAAPQSPADAGAALEGGAMPEGGGADATVTDAAASDAAAVEAGTPTGTPVSFFIDDIKWTM
jgi:hypothetical protein